MGNLDSMGKFLTRDPVGQAMLHAEAAAHSAIQHRLLDAVLEGNAQTVRRLLEEEDHARLLPEDFFLSLAFLLMARADPAVVQVFHEFSYDAQFKPGAGTYSADLRMVDIALWVCPPERQHQLVQSGFLSVPRHGYTAMGGVDPAQFDLWSRLYLAREVDQADPVPPAAGLEIFRWLPEAERKTPTPAATVARAEMKRRLDVMVQGFLNRHYPASSAQERWEAFLANPPTVAAHASGARECMVFMKVLLDHQLNQAPGLRQQRVAVSLERTQHTKRFAHLAHGLLQAGFAVSQFENDIAGDVLRYSLRSLRIGENPPESINQLWCDLVCRLHQEQPERVAMLPSEITGVRASLQLLKRWSKPGELAAFCDALEMQLASPSPQSNRPRPRL